MTENFKPIAANKVRDLIHQAESSNASDIHLEPSVSELKVRFRIDGLLTNISSIPKVNVSEIISYIKIITGLRTDQHHIPQDGRFSVTTQSNSTIHLRVSMMPTFYGEKVVLRLLPTKQNITHSPPGLSTTLQQKLRDLLNSNSGMIIVTGPTGSGKTTTLYHCLELMASKKNISVNTLEDPVEYAIEGVTQIPINDLRGLSFSNGLRTILRQDPDAILVGEIRDSETALLAIQAALTGHLLLTTLHTTDAVTAIPRLYNMGVQPYLITSTLRAVLSQRLLRTICSECKTKSKINDENWNFLQRIFYELNKDRPEYVFIGSGCAACRGTGYKGRTGVFELLEITKKIKSAISKNLELQLINLVARRGGMTSFVDDAWQKVVSGTTSLEELIRISYERTY